MAMIAISALVGKTSLATDNGRAAADFLNIDVGARGAGLGSALTSSASDASAIYWNPSGMVNSDRAQLSFSHFIWLQDINYDFLGAAYPVSERIAIGASAQYLDYGKIDGYDNSDNPTGQIGSTFDMAGSIAIACRLTENISFGASGKLVMISLADSRASAMAADLGLMYARDKFSIGLAASNLGGKLKFEREENNLPANLRGGVTVKPFGSATLISCEAKRNLSGELDIRNGVEYSFDDRYFIRAGYIFAANGTGLGLDQGISLGVGAILGPTQIDYAYTPLKGAGLDSVHRFTLGLRLGR